MPAVGASLGPGVGVCAKDRRVGRRMAAQRGSLREMDG